MSASPVKPDRSGQRLYSFPVSSRLYQFVIICEPEGLRVHLRRDRGPNQDFGLLFPPMAVGQAQQWCNAMLGLPDDAPFFCTEIAGIQTYYSQVVAYVVA